MTKAEILPDKVFDKDVWNKLQNTYSIHQLVWSLFSKKPDDKRDFLYRYEFNRNVPTFYVVSKSIPANNLSYFNIDVKTYDPKINPGQHFLFSLRANPVVTKRDENGKQKRHDVVMDEKYRLQSEKLNSSKLPPISEIAHEKGLEWLNKKGLKNGFTFDWRNVRADGYQTHNFKKPKGSGQIKISTLDFDGMIQVTDMESFTNALFNGIGPAKSFGCGLMLVKPIR
ncbi:type I-E CRISPR-associated protein Cas6/Cse3/CasE [Methanosalsum zhilinae]|nr:type I-E CRISPR-associated protein Cas6/Cse3/CasE [Methanosalsum zhilinae]